MPATVSTKTKVTKSHRSNQSSASERVQVIVRCRPPNDKERNQTISVNTGSSNRDVQVIQKLVHGKEIAKTFSFDQVYGPNTTQKELFMNSMKPIVDEVLTGYNCTIFAYGQTSTGKTYTMEGDRNPKSHAIIDSKAGVIQRSVNHIFQTLDANDSEYTIKLSCMELYNEELQDLLSQEDITNKEFNPRDSRQDRLRIFDDRDGKGTLVHGLEEVIVRDAQHVLAILEQASRKRRIAETILNQQSSRSHAITTITIHIRESGIDGEEVVKTGKLNLVDLAGSENIGRSGAQDKRAKEAGMINQSLLTLGRVITSLCNHQPHVPYRESKLTRLLQDSLGGKTKTCIIATISPSILSLEETLSTLDYAYRAKNIHNKPEVNMKIAKGALIKEMASDMEKLKAELQMQRDRSGGVFLSQDAFEQKEESLRQQTAHIAMQEQRIEGLEKELEEMNENNGALTLELDRVKNELDKAHNDLIEARDTIKSLEHHNNVLVEKIREHEYVYHNTKSSHDTLFEEAGHLLDDLHSTRQSEDQLHDKVARHVRVEDANEAEKGSFRQEMLSNLDGMKQRAESFLSEHSDKYKSMSQLLVSQKQQQQALCNSLEQQSRKMVDTFVNEHVVHSLKQQIVDQNFSTKQGCSLTTHKTMLDQFEKSIADHTEKVKTSMMQWSEHFGTQVKEQHSIMSQICQQLESRTTECQQELHRFLEQQLCRVENIEDGVMKEYAKNELQRFEKERAHIVELQKQFQTRHSILRQKLVEQFTHVVEQQTQEHQEQIETLVNSMSTSLTQTENNMRNDMLAPLQRIITQEMRNQMSNHLDCYDKDSMLHKLDNDIGKRLLSGAMKREINANRFEPLQSRLNKTITENMISSEYERILIDNVPGLQQSIENQDQNLSELLRDFSNKVADIRESTNNYLDGNQLKTLSSWKKNQDCDLSTSKQHLDDMMGHVTSHQQQDLIPSMEQHMDGDVDQFTAHRLKRVMATGGTPPRNKKRRTIPANSDFLPNANSYEEYANEFSVYDDKLQKQTTQADEDDSESITSRGDCEHTQNMECTDDNEDETTSTFSLSSTISVDSTSKPNALTINSTTNSSSARPNKAVLSPSNKANMQRQRQQQFRSMNEKPSTVSVKLERNKTRTKSAAVSPLPGRKFVRSRSTQRPDPITKENTVPRQR